MGINVHPSCIELPLSDIKKKYSEDLFSALCAHSKYLCQEEENDYGVDYRIVQLIDIGNNDSSSYIPGPDLLLFQVKSTVDWELVDGNIKYKLDNKAYNLMALRNKQNMNPVILILCCLPDKPIDWLEYHKSTSIYINFYWYKLESEEGKENVNSKTTVYIPQEQRVQGNTLTELIDEYNVQPLLPVE